MNLLSSVAIIFGVLCSAAASAASTPRLSDGRPDLNGTWDNGGGIDFVQPKKSANGSICVINCGPAGPRAAPDRPKYKPQFAAKVKELNDHQVQLDPALRCKPPGVPRIGPPDKIVQTAREIVFLYDDISGPVFRVIALGRKHDIKDVEESYLGHAVGRWEGDTLVVDTLGFNDDTWLTDNGAFHTADLRVTERLHRDGDVLHYEAIADDSQVLAEPWKLRPRTLQRSDTELPPPVPCVEQDLSHVVDGTHHDNLR